MTPGSREALALLARTEGILLDPVYTGKAMAGLIDDARQGRLGANDRVVFIHTGGTPAVFAYRDELMGQSRKTGGRSQPSTGDETAARTGSGR